jgi:hypothetical protein
MPKHGISSAIFYKWKAKYGGLKVSDANRLKAFEDENAKLKKLLAEPMLDNAMLKDIAVKKMVGSRMAMRQRERGCANWHSFGGDLAIAGFISCSNAKASS